MATIHNSDLSREIRDGGKIQQNVDPIPSQLAEKVVPVMEVNPKLLRRINVVRHSVQTTTGSLTIYTTPSGNIDFYLSSIYMSYNKDVVCDSATGSYNISTTIDGVTRRLVDIPIITLTADSKFVNIEFPIPIKIDRGVAITMSGTFTAGVCSRTCGLTGYTVDNVQA